VVKVTTAIKRRKDKGGGSRLAPAKGRAARSTHRSAEDYARRLVDRLLSEDQRHLAEAVVLAAALHGLGKDRPQWQRAIRNDGVEPLAKSSRPGFDRTAIGGCRHEFGSMMEAATDLVVCSHPERDLILHLIAAHHGHGRPGFEEIAYDCPRHLLRECAAEAQDAEERFAALQRRLMRKHATFGTFAASSPDSVRLPWFNSMQHRGLSVEGHCLALSRRVPSQTTLTLSLLKWPIRNLLVLPVTNILTFVTFNSLSGS
jgi:hypothetical protein